MSEIVWIPKSMRNEKIEITKEEGYDFYDEYGNLIHSTKIVLEKKKYKKEEALDKISCLGAQIGDILLHMKGHHHVTITETDVILYDEDMSLFHSDPF